MEWPRPMQMSMNMNMHPALANANANANGPVNNKRVIAASPIKNALGERLKGSSATPVVKLLAGMAGGVAEAVCLQPLDVVKTRLQLDNTGKYKGMINALRVIPKEEGVLSLYKGLTPFVTHLTLKYALRFSGFEFFKNLIGGGRDGKPSPGKNFTAGLMIGCTEACMIVTPFEVIKTRLQKQHGTTNLKYKGPIDVLVKVLKEEGPKRLWAGNMATVIRQGSNQAFNFMSISILNKALWGKKDGDGKRLAVWQTLLSGLLAGAVGPCFNSPVDIVKTRMMAQEIVPGQTPKYTSWHQTIRVIAAEEGPQALWRGLIPRLTRLAPGQAITWTVVLRVTSMFEEKNLEIEKNEKFAKA